MWFRFFRQARKAKDYALIDRTLGADDAMKLGILYGTPKPKVIAAPVRRDRDRLAARRAVGHLAAP